MDFSNWKNKFFKGKDAELKGLEKAFDSLNCNIAVYAISGDPPTWGHADIMMRASKKFSQIYWVIGKNPKKQYMFTDEDKLKMMEAYVSHYKLNNIIIDFVDGSIARYAVEKKAKFLIRGLRNSSDFDMEYELSVANRGISKGLETICMFTKPHYATISSSIVREVALLGEKVSQYVHPEVEKIIKDIVNKSET
jgi:pantetheine-phosphate adenylyltransferase